ncbi:MAG TPA: ferritin family protein [Casimicrobiaceae bacterium]|nr:ferritin family protein [Casimicrobiaceae bacterium]
MNAAMEVRSAHVEQEGIPQTLAELMALALAMEREAAQRYAEFADAMEIHNNLEVADLFRKMAAIETGHVKAILAQMEWRDPPAVASDAWLDAIEGPETPRGDEVHYLMQPWHALAIALACEERAERFYERLARMATQASVRDAARELQREESEHVALVRRWMEKVEKPDEGWRVDPDPPRYTD